MVLSGQKYVSKRPRIDGDRAESPVLHPRNDFVAGTPPTTSQARTNQENWGLFKEKEVELADL